jgi:hypothetical protein
MFIFVLTIRYIIQMYVHDIVLVVMIKHLKLYELPNLDPYLVQHVHITKIKSRLECRKLQY